jgi:hypothetical protein
VPTTAYGDWKRGQVPLPEKPDTIPPGLREKMDNLRLVASALELLAAIWPEIPGASVTLSPAQLEELKRILLSLPASVVI